MSQVKERRPVPRYALGSVAVGIVLCLLGVITGGLGWSDCFRLLQPFILFGVWLEGIVSAASYPDAAYRGNGWQKGLVIAGLAVVPLAIVPYLAVVRPRLRSYVPVRRSPLPTG